MSDFDTDIDTERSGEPRRWTGRTILFSLLGFFGVVMAVNGLMTYEALSTLSGVDTESAYQAGRMFEQDVAMAKAQDARRWQVDATVTPSADGARLDLVARDATGQPVSGVDAAVTFQRPTDRRLDRNVAVAEDAPGRFHGNAAVARGQWDLIIELTRHDQQLFRSKNRIVLK